MPDYRKLHNGHGNSQKLALLSDYEFRVWNQYRATADDFGVCPFLPAKLQGDNRRLATDPPSKVLKAMKRLIEVELVIPFDHQGQVFICSPNWQDFEDIKYPRRSLNPVPGEAIQTLCSESTRNLFSKSENHFQDSVSTRAGARETQTLTQTKTPTLTLIETRTKTEAAGFLETPNIWTRLVDALPELGVSSQSIAIWFAPCRLVKDYQDRIIVAAPNALTAEWITKHYAKALDQAATALTLTRPLEFKVLAERGAA